MVKDEDLQERKGEFEYVKQMGAFYKNWIKENFSINVDVQCDEMVTHKRSLFDRLDTHTIVKDHKFRGEDIFHFYLCHFRPTWTDCTCEGYHAENFGMVFWQKPKEKDGLLFLAEKNCTTVSHELAHEFLRQKKYKRYVQDVHDVWTKHFHADLPFASYDANFQKTEDKPMFLTIDMSSFNNLES